MTREEIENIPKNVNTLLDLSVTMLTRQKLNEKLNKVCELAVKSLEQEPCGDAISRQAVLVGIDRYIEKAQSTGAKDDFYSFAELVVKELPSVNPQEKTGHWIKTPKAVMGEGYMWYCDKCGYQVYQDSSKPYPSEKYCPNCGAKMESEDIK